MTVRKEERLNKCQKSRHMGKPRKKEGTHHLKEGPERQDFIFCKFLMIRPFVLLTKVTRKYKPQNYEKAVI